MTAPCRRADALVSDFFWRHVLRNDEGYLDALVHRVRKGSQGHSDKERHHRVRT